MPPRIATSNLDLRARLASEPVSPCYGELSPCYGEIISLLRSCSSCTCTANFPQAIVIKINFPAKTGPETANSPCFLPVIREYQGAKPLSNAGLILPSSLPSKLGWSPGDLRCVNALARRLRRIAPIYSTPFLTGFGRSLIVSRCSACIARSGSPRKGVSKVSPRCSSAPQL